MTIILADYWRRWKSWVEGEYLVVVTSDHAENLGWHILPGTRQKVIFHDHGISLKDSDVQVH